MCDDVCVHQSNLQEDNTYPEGVEASLEFVQTADELLVLNNETVSALGACSHILG